MSSTRGLVGAFSVITNLRMDLRFKLYTPPCDCFYALFSQPEIRSCIGSSRSASVVTTLGPDLEMWSSAYYFYFRKGASRFMGRTFPSPYLTCLTCHYNKSCLVWRNYVEAAAELSQSSPCRGKSTRWWPHEASYHDQQGWGDPWSLQCGDMLRMSGHCGHIAHLCPTLPTW